MNDGNLKCVDWGEVGLSMLGGGLTSALFKGAFRFKRGAVWYNRSGKRIDPHSWDATRKWMDKEGIQPLKPGQHRHHWLCERNQGWCKNLRDWFKNQPWNTNPISDKFNTWLVSRPKLAWMGGPSWAAEVPGGGAMAAVGGECDKDCI